MLDEKTLNGIPASDLFVSDPVAIVLGQRLNDIKGDLEFALVQLSRNPARVSRSIEVALTKDASRKMPNLQFGLLIAGFPYATYCLFMHAMPYA